jgi:hypothetical protein
MPIVLAALRQNENVTGSRPSAACRRVFAQVCARPGSPASSGSRPRPSASGMPASSSAGRRRPAAARRRGHLLAEEWCSMLGYLSVSPSEQLTGVPRCLALSRCWDVRGGRPPTVGPARPRCRGAAVVGLRYLHCAEYLRRCYRWQNRPEGDSAAPLRRTTVVLDRNGALGSNCRSGQERSSGGNQDDHDVCLGPGPV